MALMALHWAFVFEIMARNADLVCDVLAPAVNNSDLGLVAVEAVVMRIRLVFPMLKPEFHDPHLEIDDFTAAVFGWFCESSGQTSRDNQ